MAATASSSERVLYISESPTGSMDRREKYHTESMERRGNKYHSESSNTQVHVLEERSQQISSGTNVHTKVHTWGPMSTTAEIHNFDANHNFHPVDHKQQYTTSSTATLQPVGYPQQRQAVVIHAPNVQPAEFQEQKVVTNTITTTTTQQEEEPQFQYHLRRINSDSAAAELRGHQQTTAQTRERTLASVAEGSQQTMYRDVGHATVTGQVRRRGMENGHVEKREKRVVIEEGGQCTCCPYGFHVDLDFVNFCETINDGSYLKKLKRLQREKRKLRKSMEVFLQQQENIQQQQQQMMTQTVVTAESKDAPSHKVLDEIDSSVDATLASIDTMMFQSNNTRLMSSESDGTSSSSSPYNTAKFNTFPRQHGRNIQEEINQFNTSFETSGRTDSQSSLSSISTVASERNTPLTLVPMTLHTNSLNYAQNSGVSSGQTTVTTETSISKITHITSEQLAATMAMHLPTEDGAASSQSTTTSINKSSLTAIREAMAFSLQRMRELEEQVKAIPVLQVRISVLKEEKRLLMLQQKAKDAKMNMRSIGVGEDRVDSFSPVVVSTPTTKFEFTQGVKTPPPVMPKPKVRSKGVGDNTVLQPYLVQPDLPPSYTVRDNETFVQETILLERAGTQSAVYSPFTKPKPLTRTIGVGENNVFEDLGMKIHEKELRTVIIGQAASGKRNVGVDCRVATRDVGVSFSFDDEKPATRSVGVNVDTGSLLSSLSFKADEMRSALREVLHRNVRSVATNCDFKTQTMDKGIQFSSYSLRSIGVGDADVNIKLFAPVMTKTVGCEAQPHVTNKSVNTDYGWRLDAGTNTTKVYQENRSTSTEKARLWSAATMTEEEQSVNDSTQTDTLMFMRMDQLKNVGSNTRKVPQHSIASNTDIRELTSEEFNLEIKFRNRGLHAIDRACNTEDIKPRIMNRSCNTDKVMTFDVGVSDDRLDSFVCSFNDEERMEETTEEITYIQEAQVVEGAWSNRVSGQASQRRMDVSLADDRSHKIKQVVETPSYAMSLQQKKSGGSYNDGKKSDSWQDGKIIKQKMSQVSSDQKNWQDVGRSEDVVEKKISSQGDAYTVTTITRNTLGDENIQSGGRNMAVTRISGSDSSSGFSSSSGGRTGFSSGGGGFSFSSSGSERSSGSSGADRSSGYSSGGGQSMISSSGGGQSMMSSSGGGQSMMSSSGGGQSMISSSGGGQSMMSSSGGGQSMMSSSGGGQSMMSSSGGGQNMMSSSGGGQNMMSSSGGGQNMMSSTSIIRTSSSMDGGLSASDESFSRSSKASKLGAELDLLAGGGGKSRSGSKTVSLVKTSGQTGSDQSISDSSASEEVETETIEIETITTTSTTTDKAQSYYEQYVKDGDKLGFGSSDSTDGVRIIMPSSSSLSESSGGDSSGTLKSCMKKDKANKLVKKGISFAENVVGGYTSSSAAEESSEGEGDSDSESTTSYEEGSYDGREGSIVYHCKDDEAIAKGIPGAKMFDQNIRETFELDREMAAACAVLAKYLEDSTEVQTKELNASLNVIQKEWFRISSQKLSEEHRVEDYLSSFNEISRRLLEYIVNIQDSNGNTAVHYAISHCNFEIVNLLLDTGKVDLDKQNKAGYTPTMLATLAYPQTERQQEVVQRLFSMGDINARASKDGQTALMLAVSQGRTEIVQTLLDAGANVNAQDNEGSTAMMVACEHGYTDIVKLLLAQPNCDPSLTDHDGSTPLSIAMEAGNKDIGILLYASLNFKKQSQVSPGFTRSRKSSSNTSPLASPSVR